MTFAFPEPQQPPQKLDGSENTNHVLRNGLWQEQTGDSLEDTLREIQEIWSLAQRAEEIHATTPYNQKIVRGALKYLYDIDVPVITAHNTRQYIATYEEGVPFIEGLTLTVPAEEELTRISTNLQAGHYKNPYTLAEFINSQVIDLIRAGTTSIMIHATRRKETDPATEYSAMIAIAGHITDHALLGMKPFCATQAWRAEIMRQLNKNHLRIGASAYSSAGMHTRTEQEFTHALKQELAFIDHAFMHDNSGLNILSKHYIGKTPDEWPTHSYAQ